MFTDRLDGDRTFARVHYFDLSCPQCGRVYTVTRHTPIQIYNRRTGIFRCLWCRLELAIGLLLYRVIKPRKKARRSPATPSGYELQSKRKREAKRRYNAALKRQGMPELPEDWTPSIREALQLREFLQIGVVAQPHRRVRESRNLVIRQGCICDLESSPPRLDPACPVPHPGHHPGQGTGNGGQALRPAGVESTSTASSTPRLGESPSSSGESTPLADPGASPVPPPAGQEGPE